MFLRDLLTPTHLLVILVVYLLFFGTRKLPQLGKNLGEGIIGLKEAFREAHKAAAGEPEAAPVGQPALGDVLGHGRCRRLVDHGPLARPAPEPPYSAAACISITRTRLRRRQHHLNSRRQVARSWGSNLRPTFCIQFQVLALGHSHAFQTGLHSLFQPIRRRYFVK